MCACEWKSSALQVLYILLLGIDLPEDAIVLKRQISLTDECYWHIVAEVVFMSNQDYDIIKETIWTENRIIMRESQNPIDRLSWRIMSPAAVYESCCASYISVKEMDELAVRYPEYQKWFCVSLSVSGKSLRVFTVCRVALIFVITVVFGIVNGIKRKRENI